MPIYRSFGEAGALSWSKELVQMFPVEKINHIEAKCGLINQHKL
jgi:hypothetical protein